MNKLTVEEVREEMDLPDEVRAEKALSVIFEKILEHAALGNSYIRVHVPNYNISSIMAKQLRELGYSVIEEVKTHKRPEFSVEDGIVLCISWEEVEPS